MDGLQLTLDDLDAPRVDATVTIGRVELDGTSWVDVAPGWLRGAATLLDDLVATVPWRHRRRRMYDRNVDEPRLSRWYRRSEPLPHPVLVEIRAGLEGRYRVPFGGFALNFYRDGRDSVAPHRDRELRCCHDSLVAIVTLGAARPFRLRPVGGGPSRTLRPASGDLVVMGGRCQADWEHAIPKVAAAGPRISLSLRWSGSGGSGHPLGGPVRPETQDRPGG